MLHAALATLLDNYFDGVGPYLGPRYSMMCENYSGAGGASFAGGAPAVYIGDGPCTSAHVDLHDSPLADPTRLLSDNLSGGCTVFLKVGWNELMCSSVLDSIDEHLIKVAEPPCRREHPSAHDGGRLVSDPFGSGVRIGEADTPAPNSDEPTHHLSGAWTPH